MYFTFAISDPYLFLVRVQYSLPPFSSVLSNNPWIIILQIQLKIRFSLKYMIMIKYKMILIWLKQITYLHVIFLEYFPSLRMPMSNRHSSKAINSIFADWKYTALYIGHLLYDNWSRSYKRANLRNYPVTSMSNSSDKSNEYKGVQCWMNIDSSELTLTSC